MKENYHIYLDFFAFVARWKVGNLQPWDFFQQGHVQIEEGHILL